MNPARVRAILERHGLALRRDLGQNFLIDEALARRLVEEAGVEASDTVFEIGTGLGALTRALAARARRVVTLEIDAGLVRALHAEALLPDGVELVHADVLRFDLAGAVRAVEGPVRVVANLPYSISGPALRRLLDLRGLVVDWSVMLQKEVAARVLAEPGTRDYGSLAVLHRLTAEVTKTRELSPGCFHPQPRVRSSFLRMRPRVPPVVAEAELEHVERVVRAAFSQRRKTIANALRDAGWSVAEVEAALAQAGIAPAERAERVPPDAFLRLARATLAP